MDGGGGGYYRGNAYRGGWRGGGRGGGGGGGRFDDGYSSGGRGGYQGYDDRGYQNQPPPPRGGPGRGGYQGGPPPPRGGYQGGYYEPQGGRGGGRGGAYYDDGYQQAPPGGRGRGGRGRYSWGRSGGRHSGPPPQQRRRDTLPDDVSLLTELKKHDKQVTCLFYDPGTQQLYSGSSDGSICAWSCSSGQLVSSDNVAPFGVDSIRVEGGFMFVGMSRGDEGIVKGQVYALAVANNALFTAGQDTSIRVWQFNEAAGIFMAQTILNAASGDGHKHGVHSLTVLGQFMFSGDRGGAMKVWDLAQGACVQTVARAHDNAITTIMGWGENYLLTSGLDGTIKVWSPGSSSSEIVNSQPEFRWPEEDERPSGGRGGYRQPDHSAIVTMFGSADGAGKSVLLVASVRERAIKLLELPNFAERGSLPEVFDCRALSAIPEHSIMLAGDRSGAIKIFQWKAPMEGGSGGM